jgi:anti-sigma factor RsiW
MFDFLRNRGRSDQERRQEALSAYLDGELTPADHDRFEQRLAENSDLRDDLAEMQFWRQQMRDLPPRRVPRNFTLDPALYGSPQRQFWSSAYPILRNATALTALLFIIALAANVYMSSFPMGAVPQSAEVPALESTPLQSFEVAEEAPEEIAQEEGEMTAEERVVVETDVVEEEELPSEMPAEAPLATPFALETSIDKETEAAEAPVEISGADEASAAAAVEEPAEEPKFSKPEGPIAEELREELAQSLDIIEETPGSPPTGAEESGPSTGDESVISAEEIVIEETSPAAEMPTSEDQVSSQPTTIVDNIPSVLEVPLFWGLDGISLGLGLLLIFLIIGTMVARGRR